MDDEIAPVPDDVMEIVRSPSGYGWMVRFDGHVQSCFSTSDDMCEWIKTALKPLDIEAGVIPRAEPIRAVADNDMPRILSEANAKIETKPARMWRVFAGGRR